MLQYILKLSISLAVVYGFYWLLLRRLTFYTLNRWYLVVYSLFCFVIPCINVFTLFSQPALQQSVLVSYIPVIGAGEASQVAKTTALSPVQIAMAIMVLGMLCMAVRLLIQYYSLYKMRSKAVLLYDSNVKLYHVDAPVIPFSFGKAIYLNQHQHSEHELKDIIQHEFIHVKQRHSFDIIYSELLCIVNWYNPFAWLLKKDIRQNLEFIADQQVLQTGLDRKQYQYLLLKVVGINSFSIASNFNFSSLKKRIAMMNKAKTAKVHVLRFLFILPLLVVVLLAFRNTARKQQPAVTQGLITDTVPQLKRDTLKLTRREIQKDSLGVIHIDYGDKPGTPPPPLEAKDISSIEINRDNGKELLILTARDGHVEKYNMKDPKDKDAFEKRYGLWPPSPDHPKTPAPPAYSYKPATAEDIRSVDVVKANDQQLVTINFKDGRVEKYDLKDPKDKKTFEEKYGKLPEPPAPPAPALAPPVPDGAAPAAPPVPPAAPAPAAKSGAAVSVTPLTVIKADPVITAVHTPSPQTEVLAITPAGNAQVAVRSVNAVHATPVIIADRVQLKLDNMHEPEAVGTILNKFSEQQLESLKKDLQEKGYTLTIDNTTYVNGVLANVSGRVSDSNGQKCSFSASDFRSVVIARQKKANGQPDGLLVLIESNTAAL